ncbi:MAG: hypothetical protein QOG79_6021 [Mycobacterium sp.]|jgi:hypothetical protein|nr:hypothetical protein [Mycobacterium sp.]MDT5302779.1 hypothetical protein [Mycobacterium sp.]
MPNLHGSPIPGASTASATVAGGRMPRFSAIDVWYRYPAARGETLHNIIGR